jgi:putative ABC transport system permease protein
LGSVHSAYDIFHVGLHKIRNPKLSETMEPFFKDIRYGFRSLVKAPGFTVVALITLALGIGANTAIFSVVNAVLLRPLPFPESERVMWIGQQFSGSPAAAGQPKFLFWREQSQVFESMAAYEGFRGGGNLAGGNEAEYVGGLHVSSDFFRVLGVNPSLGRAFTPEDDTPGAAPVAILADGLWRRRFNSDAAIVGKTISLNGKSVTVVGVVPRQLNFLHDSDLFEPLQASLTGDPNPNTTVIGRLKAGVNQAQAVSELRLIAEKYRALNPKLMQPEESAGVWPYQDLFTSNVRELLWILLGAVGFLLLIACANVANLQLTRAAGRQKEIAVRRALGASGPRVVRQLLTEGLLLSLAGGVAGLLLAAWGTQLLVAALPQGFMSRANEVSLDWRVVIFALTSAVITGVLFGLAPALQASRINVNTVLKETARQGGGARGRLRSLLVVVEVALTVVLLAGAALLIRSFNNLRTVTPGFDSENVLTAHLDLKGEKYDSAAEESAFYRDTLERIRRLPGVESAAVTNVLPLQAQFNMPVVFPGRADSISAQFRLVTPEYFQVMKIAVQKGRAFSEADLLGAQPVAIVNESFERRFINGVDPFTQSLAIGRGLDDSQRQVVGVVGDVKQFGMDRAAPPMVYVPLGQVGDKLMTTIRRFVSAYVAVRTTVPPLSLSVPLKREVAALDPALPLDGIRPMDQVVARSIAPQRFNMLLITAFASVGLALAAVGIFGVMSYSVAQRTNELGIRIALGAQASDVVKLVLRRGIILTLSGVAIGLAGAFGLTRLMASLLFGVTPTDPLTFGTVTVTLIFVALLACYIPARRATKVDPLEALRYE